MSFKEEFIEIFKANITREGADKLLDYLEHKSDFFTAPASARYHGAYEGGLCEHSLNVYHCLVDYLQRERVQELYGLEYTAEDTPKSSGLEMIDMSGVRGYDDTDEELDSPPGWWSQRAALK